MAVTEPIFRYLEPHIDLINDHRLIAKWIFLLVKQNKLGSGSGSFIFCHSNLWTLKVSVSSVRLHLPHCSRRVNENIPGYGSGILVNTACLRDLYECTEVI